jgi:ADP-dependent NAD(P)H-hydrate dehydratase / NAD(P)H-hydrate epimerase
MSGDGMIKLVSVNEIRAIEDEANRKGFSYAQMMICAGEALGRIVDLELSPLKERGAIGLVGPGNNGGDTLIALAYLAEKGWKTTAFLTKPRTDADPLIIRYRKAGGLIFSAVDSQKNDTLKRTIKTHAVFLDGLMGTGTRLPLKKDSKDLLSWIKGTLREINPTMQIIAVDCPSGVDCDTGSTAHETIPAHLTVTMAAIKKGLLNFPAYSFVGRLRVVDIGLPVSGTGYDSWLAVNSFVPDASYINTYLPERSLDSHKGTFGTTLISAGCINFPGAAYLAGKAAYLSGTGLVTMAVPATVYSILAGNFPEAIWLPLPEESGYISANAASVLSPHLNRATAVLIGPGFGLQRGSQDYIFRLLSGKLANEIVDDHPLVNFKANPTRDELPPIIIDADALKLISQIENWWDILPPDSILTPHPGEMSILTGLTKEVIQQDRIGIAQKYSSLWKQVVVLKGAFTVIANPSGTTAVIPIATPALARAGTGDVLAGLIAGLRAQGVGAFHAAILGAWIHAHAGIKAGISLGNTASVLASDVLNAIPSVISDVISQR